MNRKTWLTLCGGLVGGLVLGVVLAERISLDLSKSDAAITERGIQALKRKCEKAGGIFTREDQSVDGDALPSNRSRGYVVLTCDLPDGSSWVYRFLK